MRCWRSKGIRRRGATARGICALSVQRTAIALALVAAIVSGAARAQSQASLELGDVRAVPSRGAALVFQLPIMRPAHSPLGTPTVVVRRPGTVLWFVANNTLELHLLELADVELEVSHGGQTVNRLLLKTELQAARARMLSGTRRDHDQTAKAPGIENAGLLRSSIAVLQQEMAGMRGEIQQVADHVATLASLSERAGAERLHEPRTFSWILVASLGGLLVAGLASLLTGYAMWRRGLAAAMGSMGKALPTASGSPLAIPSAQSRAREERVQLEAPSVRLRQVRLSYKAWKQVAMQSVHDQGSSAHDTAFKRVKAVLAHSPLATTSDREAMLANLWQELISAQQPQLSLRDGRQARKP